MSGVHHPQVTPPAPEPQDCGHAADHGSGGDSSLLATLSSSLLGLGGTVGVGHSDSSMTYDPHVSASLSVPDVGSVLPLDLGSSGDHGLLDLGSLDLPLFDHCGCHGLLNI